MDELKAIERRLARLESRDLTGMGYEAARRHAARIGDLRVEMARAALQEVLRPDAVDLWMGAPNPMFGGDTPEDAARTDPDRVMEAVHRLRSGEPT